MRKNAWDHPKTCNKLKTRWELSLKVERQRALFLKSNANPFMFIHVSSLRGWACQFLAWQFPCSHCRVKALWSENLHITLRLPGKDQSTQMKKHSMKCNKDSSLPKLSPFLYPCFFRSCLLYLEKHPWPYSWVAAHHSANTILVFLPNGFLKPPKWTGCEFKSCISFTQDTQQIQKPWGCWECLRLLLLDVWRILRSSQSDLLPTPLDHALRNPYRLGFNHPEKCTAPSNSFLDLSFGRFNMHLRLKSEASFRLQCSMQEHTTGYQQICTCEIPHLPRVAVNWIWVVQRVQILKEQSWISSQLQFQGTKFTWFLHQKPFDTRPKAADSWGKSISDLKMSPIASSCATAACRCTCCWHEVKKLQVDPWYLGLMISEPYHLFCAFMINRRGVW